MTRAERHAQIVGLCAEGLTCAQIARELGLSRQMVSEVLHDPDGSKGRARKDSYRGTCEGCGAATTGCYGPGRAPRLCAACSKRSKRVWTEDAIITAIQRYAAEHGRQPSSSAWNLRRPPGCPPTTIVQKRFGSWARAMAAAGFPDPLPRGYNRKMTA